MTKEAHLCGHPTRTYSAHYDSVHTSFNFFFMSGRLGPLIGVLQIKVEDGIFPKYFVYLKSNKQRLPPLC